jgi:phospholipase/carboxylesterase
MELLHTAHVPAGDGPFPTILALHGWGASAHDLFGLAPMINGGELLMICPQGPLEMETGPGSRGYGWFPISSGGPPDPAAMVAAAFQLRAFLDQAMERFPIDPKQLLLMGFSQGGVMAYDLALQDPGRFAGLVALSSWLPAEIAERAKRGPELEALPTLVIHGTSDPMIPVERARESRERLEALGVSVAHGEYEMGHEINQQSLRDVVGWLAQRFLGDR